MKNTVFYRAFSKNWSIIFLKNRRFSKENEVKCMRNTVFYKHSVKVGRFLRKNHSFFSKIVISRVWGKRGNTQTHRHTNAHTHLESGRGSG